MSNSQFNVQLASILEVLAKAAVTQICELVDNGYATLHLEISRSKSENEDLRRKLLMKQKESSGARDRVIKREPDVSTICGENKLPSASEQVSDWCSSQWRESSVHEEPTPTLLTTEDGIVELKNCILGFALVKEEILEESTPQREVEDKLEGTPGSGAAVADPHLDEDSEMTPQPGPEMLSPDPNPDPKRNPKTEPENDSTRLLHTQTDRCGEIISMDYKHETKQPLTWSREGVTKTHHTQSIQHTQLNKTGEEDGVREKEQQVNTRLSDSTRSLRCRQSRSSKQALPKSQSPRFTQSLAKRQSCHSTQSAPQCQSLCSTQSLRPSHSESTPSDLNSEKFTCPLCGKSLISKRGLKSHVRLHTASDSPFICTQCGKRFRRFHSLKIHQNIHTGARPYACKLCSMTFSDPSNLNRHQIVHTGERPSTCTQYGTSFSKTDHPKTHQRVHTIDRK